MPAAYSVDLRERIIKLYANGEHTQPEIAAIYNISLSSVKMYLRLEKNGKSLEPGHSPGRTPKHSLDDFAFIKELVKDNADATLAWFCEQVKKKTKKEIAVSGMHRILTKLGFTRKKKVYILKNKIERISK